MRLFEDRGIRLFQVAACDRQLNSELSEVLESLKFDRIVHRGGDDRADHLLIDQLKKTPIEAFDTLVIGSGDDIFAPLAADFTRCGKRVEVVSGRGKIGTDLYRIAHEFYVLTEANARPKYPVDDLPVALAYGGAMPLRLHRRYHPRG